ncbi:YfaZ family outer membrane protein [Serratia sp. UGAL515B_01]|uniref:YfaZ family outer membrane protein n=1 Tax=Serratia sp. UGAL515B_01 TaxID=2986763 RepID=UPI002955B413|nr:YfaZ family outer membrane protein [Serratia sp. UGAL515B_01]WON75634.1 YfaZ family protein [Serratia sp. UGAL515B_01]
MSKSLVACAAGLLFVMGSANAISVSGEVGQHYTNMGFGLGSPIPGLGISGNWLRSDHNGSVGSLGLDFSMPLGPLMATVGGKALYLSPQDGKSGAALALGGGLKWTLNRYISLYGEGYFAPESLTSGVKAYNEASGGVHWNVFRPLSVDVGYRYINIKGKDGHRDNTVADGPYVGVGLSF